MGRVLTLLLAVVASLGCVGPAARKAAGPATPLAYEVEEPGGGRALLFGSVHVGSEESVKLPDSLLHEMRAAHLLVLEIDLSKTTPQEMASLMLALGGMPPGQRLRQVVSDETWSLLEKRAAETGTPMAALDRLKPWAVALQFIGRSLDRAGFDVQHGVEQSLVKQAAGLPIRGLETPYEQFSLFDDLPYRVQDRMLRDALEPASETNPKIDALLDAWRRGDGKRLEQIMFEDRKDPDLEIFYAQTYDRRNERMAHSLEQILKQTDRALVVVGAGHLLGPHGMPAVLRNAGLSVRQVSGQPQTP